MRESDIANQPEIQRDVKNLFGGAFEAFCKRLAAPVQPGDLG
jgi:hypothetical protein